MDQVEELQPAVGVLLGDRDHETQLASVTSRFALRALASPVAICL